MLYPASPCRERRHRFRLCPHRRGPPAI